MDSHKCLTRAFTQECRCLFKFHTYLTRYDFSWKQIGRDYYHLDGFLNMILWSYLFFSFSDWWKLLERERGNIVEIWLDHENKEKAITENMEILQNKVNNSFSNRPLFSISHTLQKFTKFCFQGLKSRENHNSQEENNTKYHHIETIRENDFLLRSIITGLILKNLVSDNILKAIIKVRDLNLLFSRVYCLRISTMSTLGCHLNQHIELLDRHLWGEVEQK